MDRKKPVEGSFDNQIFIRALPTDNKALMEHQPEYIRQLEALPPKLRKAWLEGSWDIFEGAVFEEFINAPDNEDRRWTHVIKADGFRVRKHWPVQRAFDWGFRRPFAASYYTMDEDGVVYLIAEFYGCQRDTMTGEAIPNEGLKWDPDKVFAEMRNFEDTHPLLKGREITGVADPAIWNPEHGMSIAEVAIKHGIYFTPAQHNRLHGLMQIHFRFQFDADGYPRMYFLDSCPNMIRTIPGLQYDQHKIEDVDTSMEDHLYDTLRYHCEQHLITPMEAKPEVRPMSDPLDMFSRY